MVEPQFEIVFSSDVSWDAWPNTTAPSSKTGWLGSLPLPWPCRSVSAAKRLPSRLPYAAVTQYYHPSGAVAPELEIMGPLYINMSSSNVLKTAGTSIMAGAHFHGEVHFQVPRTQLICHAVTLKWRKHMCVKNVLEQCYVFVFLIK